MIILSISSHLGRQDALRWTPQMDESLRLLSITKSSPGDEVLVSQVRLQLLKEKADEIRQENERDCARTRTASASSAPRLLYLETLRKQLHELRSSFSEHLPQLGKEHLRRRIWHFTMVPVTDTSTWFTRG